MGSIIFGLLSALSWGGGDFFGGLASRKVSSYRVVLFADFLGLAFLFTALAIFKEAIPPLPNIILAALAGIFGTVGLVALYHAMATGLMSVATPVSALLAAVLPVIVGIATEGWPGINKSIGFGLAFFAVWLVAQDENQKSHAVRIKDLIVPLLSGVCFGTYFILIHQASGDAIIWPMVISRFAGTVTVLIFIMATKKDWRMNNSTVWPLILLNGFLDVCGNLFYILAGQHGRMDIAAVMSSLYPGATVLLAWLVLKEKINKLQAVGVLIALGVIALLTI